ncbi:MAG: FKBP-type peptidyl-prolyl cis-trans isomerase [Bacteroidales bacterium]|nr:FKBP-type peptidyl-prolyl cis-trans isomerase [Bacteroidales bacterium]
MQITKNTVVSLSYILKRDDAKGEIIEETRAGDPLVFLFGNGQMLPKFEENLSTLKTGDDFEFTLASDDAYGEMDQDAIIDLDKSIFEVDGKIDTEMIAIGNVIPMRDDQGHMLQGTVVSVGDELVRMDFNHPMAGNVLHFKGNVIEVREASAEELSHGHVHGAGGHHH